MINIRLIFLNSTTQEGPASKFVNSEDLVSWVYGIQCTPGTRLFVVFKLELTLITTKNANRNAKAVFMLIVCW